MHLFLKLMRTKAFCAQCFLCKRLLSDSWELSGVQNNWDELRKTLRRWKRLISARMRWKQLRRTCLDDMWEERGWDEVRWDEVRRAHMIWDEMKCEVWSAGCEERSVKCEESVCLALRCAGVARRSCSWTTTLQQLRTKHARTGLADARRMQVL